MNTLLALTYSFFLATMPYDNVGFKGDYEQHFNPTHVTYELGLKIADIVHVYTGEDTKQIQDGSIFRWCPYQQTYYVGIEYCHDFSKQLELRAGVKHECSHPVNCWETQESSFDSSYTEWYIRVGGEIPLR